MICGADKMSVEDFADFQDTLARIFQKCKFCPSCTKVILWQLLTQFYEEVLTDEPGTRGEILEDIEDCKEDLVKDVFGEKNKDVTMMIMILNLIILR